MKAGSSPVTDGDALIQYSPVQTVAGQIVRGNQHLIVNVTLGELQAGS